MKWRYYLLLLCIPGFFVLHRVNEYYGLIHIYDVLRYLFLYFVGTIGLGAVITLFINDHKKAFILCLILSLVYFPFTTYKEFIEQTDLLHLVSKYSVLLPLLFILVLTAFVFLRKTKRSLSGIYQYGSALILILIGLELFMLILNIYRGAQVDYGDENHALIENVDIPKTAGKPSIFWIILDAYSATTSLKQKWGFNNPLDDQLRKKQFFVADSALSPYNYTHFSLTSTLDMQYLCCLNDGDKADFKDMAIGTKSIYSSNVIELLARNGYNIYNYSIFDMKNHPAKPFLKFDDDPTILLTYTNLASAIKRDIWWNFHNIISGPQGVEKVEKEGLKQLYDNQKQTISAATEVVKHNVDYSQPSMSILHYMITHDPYVFNADGSFNDNATFNSRDGYINSIIYANKVVNDIVDEIKLTNKGREFVIIVQSDHGFRWGEAEPEFKDESCKVFYALYCSDGDYSEWKNRMSSINGFRILFNKYFETSFPMLPTKTNVLRYSQEK